MTKKEQLYYLIREYNIGNYDIKTFCDEMERIYYHEDNDHDILTENENNFFSLLANKCSRFSPYKDEIRKAPKNVFTTRDEINKLISESKKILR